MRVVVVLEKKWPDKRQPDEQQNERATYEGHLVFAKPVPGTNPKRFALLDLVECAWLGLAIWLCHGQELNLSFGLRVTCRMSTTRLSRTMSVA